MVYSHNQRVVSRDKDRLTSLVLAIVFAITATILAVLPIKAESLEPIDFESYTTGAINGQDGWVFTGSYDADISDNSLFANSPSGFGDHSLRISNASTSGSFGDWVFSKSTVNEAGETSAENGGLSGGTRENHFETSFEVGSTDSAEQAGLQMSLAPDRGDGARMSYLGFSDQSDGIHVTFYDYQDVSPFGTTVGDSANGCGTGDDFFPTEVGILDRTSAHSIKLTMDFVDGPRNDVVKVYVDGSLEHTGTSWEDYFRYCEGNETRTVDSLIFQARSGGGTAPTTLGNGFLFDNISLLSGQPPYPVSGEIIKPHEYSVVGKVLKLKAVYDDGDDVNDNIVQWAVRSDTCAASTNTVLGNVDGHHDDYYWNGAKFKAKFSTKDLEPGLYCFVFNPKDDPGQADVRETQWFYIGPKSFQDCKNDAWQDFGDSFDNQGECIRFVIVNYHHHWWFFRHRHNPFWHHFFVPHHGGHR